MSKNQITDANGQVVFNLPDQLYKVRADYLGQQFWSDPFQFQNETITINQGIASIHVKRSGSDVANATVYLFTSTNSYLSWNELTDATGIVEFLLPDKTYKFRANEGGAQVYSTDIDIQAGQVNGVEIDLE